MHRRRCRPRPWHWPAHRRASILARIAATAPVISSTVSPRTRKRHQQPAHLRGRRFARHHAIEGAGGFLARQAQRRSRPCRSAP